MEHISRKEAFELLKKYNKDPFHIQHALTVEAVMKWYANELGYGDDAQYWGIVGLLHDIDFELYPEQRAEGEILLDGDNILTNSQDIALLRAKVGMVFQKPTPFPMSIYDNIAFGVRLFEKLSRADMDERVQWALTKAALWNETKDKLHQSGYSLSGGQQQRLCIARGIAIRPEVLLLDEPCSALDPISTGRIEELITELKQDYTVVIVTHNMQQAARCSDHTAFMYLGELIEFSNTDDLFTKPAKKQTEDYITGRYG